MKRSVAIRAQFPQYQLPRTPYYVIDYSEDSTEQLIEKALQQSVEVCAGATDIEVDVWEFYLVIFIDNNGKVIRVHEEEDDDRGYECMISMIAELEYNAQEYTIEEIEGPCRTYAVYLK